MFGRLQTIAREYVVPPAGWRVLKRAKRGPYYGRRYQAMQTDYETRPLHLGRFAQSFDRWVTVDPHIAADLTRYRLYNICNVAKLALRVPGDFLCAGVSYGVAPRVVFDYVEFEKTGKTYHLIDPLTGAAGADDSTVAAIYNSDPDYVLRQYPTGARIELHRQFVPAGIPRDIAVAFAHFNCGDWASEAKSVPAIYERLSPGGFIMFDAYGTGHGSFEAYDAAFASVGVTPMWFPSGQCMIAKPATP